MSEQATNTGGEEEQFNRTYRDFNPAPVQGPMTEVLATILKPDSGDS